MFHHVFSCLLRAKVIAQKELTSRSCSFDVPTLLLTCSLFLSAYFAIEQPPPQHILSASLVWNCVNILYCISWKFSDCCSKSPKFSCQWLGFSFLWGRRWLWSLGEGCSIHGCFTSFHSARNTEIFESIFGGSFKAWAGTTRYFARKFSVAKLMPSSWQWGFT